MPGGWRLARPHGTEGRLVGGDPGAGSARRQGRRDAAAFPGAGCRGKAGAKAPTGSRTGEVLWGDGLGVPGGMEWGWVGWFFWLFFRILHPAVARAGRGGTVLPRCQFPSAGSGAAWATQGSARRSHFPARAVPVPPPCIQKRGFSRPGLSAEQTRRLSPMISAELVGAEGLHPKNQRLLQEGDRETSASRDQLGARSISRLHLCVPHRATLPGSWGDTSSITSTFPLPPP